MALAPTLYPPKTLSCNIDALSCNIKKTENRSGLTKLTIKSDIATPFAGLFLFCRSFSPPQAPPYCDTHSRPKQPCIISASLPLHRMLRLPLPPHIPPNGQRPLGERLSNVGRTHCGRGATCPRPRAAAPAPPQPLFHGL